MFLVLWSPACGAISLVEAHYTKKYIHMNSVKYREQKEQVDMGENYEETVNVPRMGLSMSLPTELPTRLRCSPGLGGL